ncbi:uncharacterized protein LOC129610396 [Condylostylus longicornis]|uniref:uncharacterized protein LOC129610396 n=1 Tax=Condylostylus longicornis TaxID=2530218 RepID=UPI00244E0415|nr:uncharacterized protein LOC129610396 [Condylostylus longicornis]
MYRSDTKYMSQMTSTEPNRFNSGKGNQQNSFQGQTMFASQQSSSFPSTQNAHLQTTFEIQPSYGYDLGSISQQEPIQQQSSGHDLFGSQSQDKSNQINTQQELSTGESFLHPQSTPFFPTQNNQYIPPAPPSSVAPSLSSSQSPPPPAPTQQQELPLPPTAFPSQPLFNPQPISNDISPPSPGLNAPPPHQPPSPSTTAHTAPSSAPSSSSSLYDDNSYQPTAYDSTDGYYPPAKQTVHKHIYVHIPPKDFDEEAPRQHFKVPRPEKHYKIIFIKTPTPTQPQPVVPPLPQNEEKTLIYVLHKKPEEPEDVTIPTPEPTQPSKPEVYFIKYKTNNLPALYGAPTPPSEEDATAAAGHGYPPALQSSGDENRSQLIEPRNGNEHIGNNGIEVSNTLYNATITNLHRYF